jgi:hypothetical protein
LIIAKDISELKKTQDELKEAKERQRLQMKLKPIFFPA